MQQRIRLWGIVVGLLIVAITAAVSTPIKQAIPGQPDFIEYYPADGSPVRLHVRWSDVSYTEDFTYSGNPEPGYILHMRDGKSLRVKHHNDLGVIGERLKDGH